MSIPFYLVNALTLPKTLHSGNQAAVVILPPSHPKSLDDDWKRLTARDFNYAETAYIIPISGEEGKYGLRWWTPTTEVTLCGHATLAAAITLFTLHPEEVQLVFTTRWSGDLIARRIPTGDTELDRKEMDVSISLPTITPDVLGQIKDDQSSETFVSVRDTVLAAAPEIRKGVRNVSKFPWGETESAIIELDEVVDLGQIRVDPKKMLVIGGGLLMLTQCISSESSPGRLVIRSRVFAPGVGVEEDPVTGSAHAYLTAYYLSQPIYSRLPSSITKDTRPEETVVDAYQLSERGGRLECRLEAEGMVGLIGRGVIWGKGELTV